MHFQLFALHRTLAFHIILHIHIHLDAGVHRYQFPNTHKLHIYGLEDFAYFFLDAGNKKVRLVVMNEYSVLEYETGV